MGTKYLTECGFSKHASMLTGLWSQHMSGTLDVYTSQQPGSPPRRLHLSHGGMVEYDQFPVLNASLKRGHIRFIPGEPFKAASWAPMGRFLYNMARSHILHSPILLQPLAPQKSLMSQEIFEAIFPDEEERPELCLNTAALPPSHEQISLLRALALMGLVKPLTAPSEVTVLQSVPDWEMLIEDFTLLPEEPASHAQEEPGIGPGVELRARALITMKCWSQARRQLESELIHNIEKPSMLQCLALAWLQDTSLPVSDRVDAAMKWCLLADNVTDKQSGYPYTPLLRDAAEGLLQSSVHQRLKRNQQHWLKNLARHPLRKLAII